MEKLIRGINTFFILYIAGLTLIFGGSLIWHIHEEYQSAEELAEIEAVASYDKDLLYRRWVSMHGGVYVPVSEVTPPNPHLTFRSDRDITTTEGKKLTLVNSAYFTRQAFELADKEHVVKGHITSLNPINPVNAADKWETEALKRFELGWDVYSGLVEDSGRVYLRYMKPVKVEHSCMACHAAQGYKEGDIRGGISLSVPMEKYYHIAGLQVWGMVITHFLIFLQVVFLSIFGKRKLLKEVRFRSVIQEKLKKRETDLVKQIAVFSQLNKDFRAQNHELIAAKEKAEESDRLKTAFLTNMSHEIRTPMNGIVGFVELLQDDGLSKDKKNKYISYIKANSNRLLSTVTDIIEISKIEAGQISVYNELVDVNRLMTFIDMEYRQDAAGYNLSFSVANQTEKIADLVYTDEYKVKTILDVFIRNAFKFTPEGSVEVGSLLKDDRLVLYVKDTGIGIPHDRQKVVFDRFIQGDEGVTRSYEGLGLGLAIAGEYARLIGGRIWVDSELQKGSTFYLSLQIGAISQKRNPLAEPKEKAEAINEPVVLVVEDDPTSFAFLEELLEDENWRLIHAKNGRIAVNLFVADPDINVILMDLKMPEMDGFEATRQIRLIDPHVPIIAQTANVLADEVFLAKASGCTDYLTKPLRKELVVNSIKKHLSIDA